MAAERRWQCAGGTAQPRTTERSAHAVHRPNVCQPKGWGLRLRAAEETKAVSAWVCYFCRRKPKSPSVQGTGSWPARWELLQVGPCVRFHTARLVILLFLQSFARSFLQHQHRTGEDEVPVVDVGRAGTNTLTCTGLAKRHWREALTLPAQPLSSPAGLCLDKAGQQAVGWPHGKPG